MQYENCWRKFRFISTLSNSFTFHCPKCSTPLRGRLFNLFGPKFSSISPQNNKHVEIFSSAIRARLDSRNSIDICPEYDPTDSLLHRISGRNHINFIIYDRRKFSGKKHSQLIDRSIYFATKSLWIMTWL